MSQIENLQQTEFEQGITLDKYFGSTFTVVQKDDQFKFNQDFGQDRYVANEVDESLQQYFKGKFYKILDDFEINEIDEDMYTESHIEQSCEKLKFKLKRSFTKLSKLEDNNQVQQKIIDKYQRKKSTHKEQKKNEIDTIQIKQFQKPKEETLSLSKEKSIKNNDSFDKDFDNHIVLRNTSSNIFRYSNYNNSFHDNNQANNIKKVQTTKYNNKQILNNSINRINNKQDDFKEMPKMYYDNNQIQKKFQQEKINIDRKMLGQDQQILNKYAHRFNLKQDECKKNFDIQSYRFRSKDKCKEIID